MSNDDNDGFITVSYNSNNNSNTTTNTNKKDSYQNNSRQKQQQQYGGTTTKTTNTPPMSVVIRKGAPIRSKSIDTSDLHLRNYNNTNNESNNKNTICKSKDFSISQDQSTANGIGHTNISKNETNSRVPQRTFSGRGGYHANSQNSGGRVIDGRGGGRGRGRGDWNNSGGRTGPNNINNNNHSTMDGGISDSLSRRSVPNRAKSSSASFAVNGHYNDTTTKKNQHNNSNQQQTHVVKDDVTLLYNVTGCGSTIEEKHVIRWSAESIIDKRMMYLEPLPAYQQPLSNKQKKKMAMNIIASKTKNNTNTAETTTNSYDETTTVYTAATDDPEYDCMDDDADCTKDEPSDNNNNNNNNNSISLNVLDDKQLEQDMIQYNDSITKEIYHNDVFITTYYAPQERFAWSHISNRIEIIELEMIKIFNYKPLHINNITRWKPKIILLSQQEQQQQLQQENGIVVTDTCCTISHPQQSSQQYQEQDDLQQQLVQQQLVLQQQQQLLEQSDEKLKQSITAILNKLSWTNVDKLTVQFLKITSSSMTTIPTTTTTTTTTTTATTTTDSSDNNNASSSQQQDAIQAAMTLVVEKAMLEPHFAELYAHLTAKLTLVHKKFKRTVLSICQEQFEETERIERSSKSSSSIVTDPTTTTTEEQVTGSTSTDIKLIKAQQRSKMVSIGLMKFIGELYKMSLLKGTIMISCLHRLFVHDDEEKIECFIKLLNTIGERLHIEMNEYIETIIQQIWIPVYTMAGRSISSLLTGNNESIVPPIDDTSIWVAPNTRIKFMLQDLIELKENGWVQVRHQVEKAKTIEEIHQQVAAEEQEKLEQSRSFSTPPFRYNSHNVSYNQNNNNNGNHKKNNLRRSMSSDGTGSGMLTTTRRISTNRSSSSSLNNIYKSSFTSSTLSSGQSSDEGTTGSTGSSGGSTSSYTRQQQQSIVPGQPKRSTMRRAKSDTVNTGIAKHCGTGTDQGSGTSTIRDVMIDVSKAAPFTSGSSASENWNGRRENNNSSSTSNSSGRGRGGGIGRNKSNSNWVQQNGNKDTKDTTRTSDKLIQEDNHKNNKAPRPVKRTVSNDRLESQQSVADNYNNNNNNTTIVPTANILSSSSSAAVVYLSPTDCSIKFKSILKEYLISNDTNETVRSIQDIVGTNDSYEYLERCISIIESGILLVMEMKENDVTQFLLLLSKCFNTCIVSTEAICIAIVRDPIEYLRDIEIDAPIASTLLCIMIRNWIQNKYIESIDYLLLKIVSFVSPSTTSDYIRTNGKYAEFVIQLICTVCKVQVQPPPDITISSMENYIPIIDKLITDEELEEITSTSTSTNNGLSDRSSKVNTYIDKIKSKYL